MKKTVPSNIEDIIALAPVQEGMLFHYLKEPRSDVYFEQLSLSVPVEIDREHFVKAWDFVIARNDMLRTCFRWEKLEKPVQVVLKEHKVDVRYYDLSMGEPGVDIRRKVEKIKIEDRDEAFDLRDVPFRLALCKTGKDEYELILSNHHILFDGWSTGILLREFLSAYTDLKQKKRPVQRPKTKYKEFVRFIRDRGRSIEEEKFWKESLHGWDGDTSREFSLKLGRDGKTGRQSKEADIVQTRLDKITKDRMEGFVKNSRGTLAALFCAAYGILLRKYNSADDVIFGTTVSVRESRISGMEEMVGLFINTLPLRMVFRPGEVTADFLSRMNHALQAREEFKTSAPVDIKGYGGLTADEELFDTIVVIENYPLDSFLKHTEGAFSFDSYTMVEKTHYDLTLIISPVDDIVFKFYFREDLFDRLAIKRLAGHYISVIKSIIADPGGILANMELLSAAEKRRILYDFNNTEASYPTGREIHQLFEDRAEKSPDHTALVGAAEYRPARYGEALPEKVSLTYRKLDEEAGRLAEILSARGIKAGAIAALRLERSVEMVTAIFAILKAGGAYLPMDPAFPANRISYLLADSAARVLITGGGRVEDVETLKSLAVDTVFIEPTPPFGHPSKEGNSQGRDLVYQIRRTVETQNFASQDSGRGAYVIYTSGSTGNPKGVLVEHSAVVNLLYGLDRCYPFRASDIYLMKTSYLFDVSAAELFGWFIGGGRLALLEKGEEKDPGRIINAIGHYRVTHINFVPSQFNVFVDEVMTGNIKRISALRYIFLAGEALMPEFVEKFGRLRTGIQVENIYGPTEGTVYASRYALSGWQGRGSVPIGKPLPNIKLYILDKDDRFQPVGVPGELCISGYGLARGYLNRPELTNEKFAASSLSTFNFQLIYHTGDLACWQPDGNIEFLGRIDRQVKIRGFCIELGEIENLLLRHESVKEAVVTAQPDKTGDHYLCAYIVSHQPGFTDTASLRDYLSERVPGYMVPAFFLFLKQVPLTPTGKIDRRSLPQPAIIPGKEYAAPRNDIEKQLVTIWSEVLGVERHRIGIDDPFFELGGHSLKAIGLTGKIHKKFDTRVDLVELLKIPTIRGLAALVNRSAGQTFGEIKAVEEKEYYALSSTQKSQFLLHQLDNDNTTYHVNGVFLSAGRINRDRLQDFFIKLINRHESLRTSFLRIHGEPVQKINKPGEIEFKIEYFDTGSRVGARCAVPGEIADLRHITDLIQAFIKPFDLALAPLFRVGLVKIDDETNLLIVDMHHIISDGASVEILAREFSLLYAGQELPYLGLRCRDYSEWQNSGVLHEIMKQQEPFWLAELAGETPALHLPYDYPKPAVRCFTGGRFTFAIKKENVRVLKARAADASTTLFTVLLAVYNVFLSKICGQEDMVVGTITEGRGRPGLESIIGMFVNALPLRNFPAGEICFNRFLGEVKQRALAALSHRDYPYEDLVEKTGVTLSTVFALLDLRFAEIEIPGLRLAPYDYFTGTAKYDLLLLAAEGKEDLNFIFEYSTACFRAETVRRFSGYFARVVSAVAEHPQVKLSEIEILSGEEKQQILCEFNETGRGYPTDKTICRLFADQVRLTSDGIALVDTGRENLEGTLFLSYRQLAEESGRLASFLVRRGVKANGLIGILVERGRFMLTGILGILISGCGYVPLNPKAHLSRNRYILKECGVKILLTTGSLKEEVEKLASSGVETVFIDEMDCRVGAQDSVPEPTPPFGHPSEEENSCGAGGIAYVIFTSGSTGRPKGIAVSHANFCPLLFWGYEELGISPGERTIQNLSYYFDWSVWEIFITLTTGAALYLVLDDVLLEPGRCIDFINLHGITILHITPTRYQYIVGGDRTLETLKYLCIGAEKLSFDLLERSITSVNEDCRVFNMYGPTEATIMSAVLEIKKHGYARYRDLGSVPIGRPIANFQLLILDKNLHLCPLNVPGELGIAGSGLARGYLNRLELTAEKFAANSLSTFNFQLIYKTGDLTRWLPDGEIEFLGRIDQQVKLRGFRIELGEIEKHLLAHPGVKEAVVRIREDDKYSKDKYLCAYLIAGRKIDPAELREFLSADLPSYMIPSYFVALDRMPLTPNGKIDHKALPEPDRAAMNDEYSAPRDEVEKKLAALWSGVLGIETDKIGIHSDFFECGGHSLKAADLTTGLHKEFAVRLPLVEVFKNPTIKELAKVVKKLSVKTFASIEAVEKKEYYRLSPVQKRMYVIRLLQKESTAYNISNVVIISGEIDSEILGKTFRQLIGRHESFRTSFFTVGDSSVQRIHNPAEIEFKIEYFEIDRGEPCVVPSLCSPETIALSIDRFIRPFDLKKAPLLRAGLVKIEKNRHLLMVDMHHIISDGLSHEILAADFAALYIGKELPPLRIQYRDFCEGQGRLTRSGEMAKQEHFWLDMFPDEHIPVLDIPVDFPRPAVRDIGAGDYIKIELGKPLCNKCYKVAEETGATLFMVTLAAYNILLSIYTNREDIVVGTLLTGRSHPDLKNIIGMFVNTLPLRNFPVRKKTFRQFLAEVKENLLAVYENQDYSFDDLIVKLRLQGDSSRNPLFDTLFTMNTLTVGLYDGPTAFRLEPYEYKAKFAKFDLYFLVTESKGTISLLLRYSTQLFKPAAVRKMASYFNEILDQVTDDPGIRLKDITLSHNLLSVKSTVHKEDGGDFKFE